MGGVVPKLIEWFGPFSRVGSILNVLISTGITATNVGFASSDFERTG